MSSRDSQTHLQSFVDKVLRSQPLARAPENLSTRVFAEIERREMSARHRKDFRGWPFAARIAFCIVSLGAVAFAVTGSAWVFALVDFAVPLSISRELALWQAALTIGASLAHSVPAHWVQAALGIVVAMYAAFFGIGAAAYRTLYEQHQTQL